MGLWEKWQRGMDKQKQATEARQTESDRREFSGLDSFGRPVRRVVLTDIEIPFWSIVGLLVQVALAAIPATIILALMYAAVKWLWTMFLMLMAART